MSGMRRTLRIHFPFPRITGFSGEDGELWFAGSQERAASVAEVFCGGNCHTTDRRRIHRSRLLSRSADLAAGGAVSVFCAHRGAPGLHDPAGRAIEAPLLVALTRELPPTVTALMEGLGNSSVREDIRRMRKAGFTYRVTTDPGAVREFYGHHYEPLVRERFPEDGAVMSLDRMLARLGQGGELLCADLDGDWVAGIFNSAQADIYAMGNLGIRDANESVRQKRVASALILRSLQRAVELGRPAAAMGASLPFLGKGSIWFKAKWGCTLRADGDVPRMLAFLDLRHETVRRALTESPVVHFHDDELAAVAWLPPEEAAARAIVREAGRYPGISKWYVLGTQDTLTTAEETLQRNGRVVPIPVEVRADAPLWLGQILRGHT
ncbi:MAG: GNAT family N-acetyltransferase [Paracoccaceae bacterium]|nr:GNAT family N-acetyltransferase [Paracoccaceae bacterium]